MTTPAKKSPVHGVTLDAPRDPLLGTTLDGRYVVEGVLGSGGMGLVYRARHIKLGKRVAVKVLRPGVATDPDNVVRFRREAQAASAIGHPHIIDVSDFGETPQGCTYFVMEHLTGVPLARVLLREGPLELARAIHIGRQLASALGAAHREGIFHRDLKPDNVFLITGDGDPDFVKVLDFGIAKILGAAKLTLPGEIFGSPGYMSPEQCRGKDVDARSDVYALGVVIFELITGRRPFTHETHLGLLEAHQHERPPFASSLRSDCPAELDAILFRCMAKKPDDRYANCEALMEDLDKLSAGIPVWIPLHLRAILDEEISSIRRLDGLSPGATAASPRPARVAPPAPASRARASRLGVVAMSALGLLATSVGLGVVAHRFGDSPAPIVIPRIAPLVLPAIPRALAPLSPVRLETDPEGADVLIDGRVVGRTPYSLTRTHAVPRVTITLHKTGFVDRTLVVSSATLDSSLHLALARTPRATAHAPTSIAPASSEPAPVATPMQRDRNRIDEVTDPWN